MKLTIFATLMLGCGASVAASAAVSTDVPAAVYTDPAQDAANPAKMEVVHIPSGGVLINGVAYVAAGAGPHPIMVLCHGLPGNEKNLDLAQAVRRAGWTVVTFNYRGSWGSPGNFKFANNLEDADAVLAFVRDPANAKLLRADPSRIVLAGHSMGGWVTAMTAAHDKGLLGAVMISAANMGNLHGGSRAAVRAEMADDMESLASTTPDAMTDELMAKTASFNFVSVAPALVRTKLFVLSSDDGLKPDTDGLIAAIQHAGGTQITALHVATDHPWSDQRIRLESEVINWLKALDKS